MDEKLKSELDAFFQNIEKKMEQMDIDEQKRRATDEQSEKEFTRLCSAYIWPALKMFGHYLKDVQGLECQLEPLGDQKHEKKYAQMTISGYHTRYDFNKNGFPSLIFYPIKTENNIEILTVMVIPRKKVDPIVIKYNETNEDKVNSIVKDFIMKVFK